MLNEIFKALTWNKKIEVLRVMKGWTQTEAADKCNTNQKAYWGWESGINFPRKNSRIAISKAFEISEEEIFSGNIKEVS